MRWSFFRYSETTTNCLFATCLKTVHNYCSHIKLGIITIIWKTKNTSLNMDYSDERQRHRDNESVVISNMCYSPIHQHRSLPPPSECAGSTTPPAARICRSARPAAGCTHRRRRRRPSTAWCHGDAAPRNWAVPQSASRRSASTWRRRSAVGEVGDSFSMEVFVCVCVCVVCVRVVLQSARMMMVVVLLQLSYRWRPRPYGVVGGLWFWVGVLFWVRD